MHAQLKSSMEDGMPSFFGSNVVVSPNTLSTWACGGGGGGPESQDEVGQ